VGDEWESYESFFKRAECKSQIQTEIAMRAEYWEKDKKESKDVKITIQQEKESLKITRVRLLADKQETSSVSISRFFCMPLGVDPRPKDPSTWILWEYVSLSENGKFIEARGPFLHGGFLTQFACERAHIAALQIQRELEEKEEQLEAARKKSSKRKVKYSYQCRPSGVNPND
jgi:hypothetical protein